MASLYVIKKKKGKKSKIIFFSCCTDTKLQVPQEMSFGKMTPKLKGGGILIAQKTRRTDTKGSRVAHHQIHEKITEITDLVMIKGTSKQEKQNKEKRTRRHMRADELQGQCGMGTDMC